MFEKYKKYEYWPDGIEKQETEFYNKFSRSDSLKYVINRLFNYSARSRKIPEPILDGRKVF